MTAKQGSTHRRWVGLLVLVALALVPVLAFAQDPGPMGNGPTADAMVAIHEIQGAAHLSPYEGQQVVTRGIVTVVTSRAFYMQDPNPDGSRGTSEGIQVYVGRSPGLRVGDSVIVTGTVDEYYPGGYGSGNLSTTQLASPVAQVVSSGNPLPAPVIIGAGGRLPPSEVIDDDATGDANTTGSFDADDDGIDFYESLEGMLVIVQDALVVGPTNSYGEIAVVGDGGARASMHTLRGGLYIRPTDFNPERILLDDAIVSDEPRVNVGDAISTVQGVMDYSFGMYKLLFTELGSIASAPMVVDRVSEAQDGALTVATYNVENLDPGDDQAKFESLAASIVDDMKAPDIIGLEEIQDNTGATNDGVVSASKTFGKLIAAIAAAGGPVYDYREIPPEDNADGGQPGANIRVGLVFRPDRVTFVDRPGGDATTPVAVVDGISGPELSISPGRVDPTNPAFGNARKSLVGEFEFQGERLFVAVSHLKSKSEDAALYGRVQPPVRASDAQRDAQAVALNAFVGHLLAVDAEAKVVLLGDFNDFQFSQPMQTLAGDELVNLMPTLPDAQEYSYIYEGNSQVLDHILVSQALVPQTCRVWALHNNTVIASRNRWTDHDPVIARFCPGAPLPDLSVSSFYQALCSGWNLTVDVVISNREACCPLSGTLTLAVPEGTWFANEPHDVRGDLPWRYDPDAKSIILQVSELSEGASAQASIRLHTFTSYAGLVNPTVTYVDALGRKTSASVEVQLDPSLCPVETATPTPTPTMTPSHTPEGTATPTATSTPISNGPRKIWLPQIFRSHQVLGVPVLHPIQNGDRNGEYAVEWSLQRYDGPFRVEESWNGGGWVTIYLGLGSQCAVTGRPAGDYDYRVRAEYNAEHSGWSNIEGTTVIGLPPGEIGQPSPLPIEAEGKAMLRIINDTPYALNIELAGPESSAIELSPCGACSVYHLVGPSTCPTAGRPSQQVALAPGRYRIFAQVNDPFTSPLASYWDLAADSAYTKCFFVVRTGGQSGSSQSMGVDR